MQAFFVRRDADNSDWMVLPEKDCMIPVDRNAMEVFISPRPDFSQWRGQSLNSQPVEAIGQVVASRMEDGDVCINDISFWQEKMTYYLSSR